MMSTRERECLKSPSRTWKSKSISSDVHFNVAGVPFALNREVLASKSSKFALLLKENAQDDLSHLLHDIPADPVIFELVARFFYGYEIQITSENVIGVSCLAHYLGMTENHCINNLLNKSLSYFVQNIIPSWNKCIKALKDMQNILQPSIDLGLVDACVESVIRKALDDPRLLGEPIKSVAFDDETDDDNENRYRPNVRRKLFALDWKPEDLTALSLMLYEPIMRAMIHQRVPLEYVTASLSQYAKKWVFSSITQGDDMEIYTRNSHKEIIEAVERLLPHERGFIPCTLLFEMLGSAVALNASIECRNGLELRIGKQLEQAEVKDLLIPSQGYAKDEPYDTECVRRILKNFYSNYNNPDVSGLINVAELIDEFLVEVASNIDLKLSSFVSIAEMSITASTGTQRNSDGIYRAIDIYLEKHRYLTESEREEVCKVLDCNKMSAEACEHAAQNDRLPLRLVVQVLFVAQLQLRDTLVKEVKGSENRLLKLEEEEETETRISIGEEEMKSEIEKMGSKVMDLERQCYKMRREMQSGCCSIPKKKEKTSMWKEMKRKFGCATSMHDCNCHVNKKKKKENPRYR